MELLDDAEGWFLRSDERRQWCCACAASLRSRGGI
jgi:hypothetical protein